MRHPFPSGFASVGRGVLFNSVNLQIDYSECLNESNVNGRKEMMTIFLVALS